MSEALPSRASELRPRAIVHRGVVHAAALLVEDALVGEAIARARVLALGDVEVARVTHDGRVLDGAWLVVLRRARSIDHARAPGLPLIARSGVLTSAPLDDDELAALSAQAGAIVRVRAGRAEVLARGEAVDPSTWLDVSSFERVSVAPLGAPRASPTLASRPPEVDLRDALGVAQAPIAARAVVAALEARAAQAAGAVPRSPSVAVAAIAGVLAWLAAYVGSRRATGSTTAAPAKTSGAGSRALAARPQGPIGPTLFDRLRARLQDLVARLLVRANLASLLGRRQARYLAELLRAFDDGDLGKALRHAIPLGDGAGSGAPALGVPTPRADLSISLGRARPGGVLGLGDDLFAELRARYRRAFERLAAEGRHDEAAFVLAELLRAAEEAVAYLERHDRLRLAAEVAEARELPPGLVVRQWFLAGDYARATAIALRTGAFADAVARLEASDPDRATQLRALWADDLANAGAFAAAVDVVWPKEHLRHAARAWIDAAIEVGGPNGARMLARKVVLAGFDEVRDPVRALLDDDALDGRQMRRAFGDELVALPSTAVTRVLARAAARALLADGDDDARVSSLVTASGDSALQSDLAAARRRPAVPAIPANTPDPRPDDSTIVAAQVSGPSLARADAPLEEARILAVGDEAPDREAETRRFVRRRADAGAVPVHDAVLLPSGRLLVALGELGARMLAPDGKVLARFLEPAHRLVASDHGDRAIALATRGDVSRLARLDLLHRRARSWCDVRLSCSAPDFDGALWFVGVDDRLFAIDARADDWRAVWSTRAPDATPDARIEAIVRSPTNVAARFASGDDVELWVHDLPGPVLRRRSALHATPRGTDARVHAEVELGESRAWLVERDGRIALRLSTSPDDDHLVLEGASAARLRAQDDRLVVCDDRGRVLVVTRAGDVEHEWRVS